MNQRLDVMQAAPEALQSLYQATAYLKKTTLEPELLDLVRLRASQMNGCAFCLAMHWREARHDGVDDDRINGLNAWHEAPWYSERERAALAWTEALTDISRTHAPDETYAAARAVFSERELVDLTLAITTINSFNRFAIGFRSSPERAADLVAALRQTN